MFSKSRRFKSFPTAPYGMLLNAKPAFTDDGQSFAELSFTQTTDRKRNGSFYARLYQNRYDYHCDEVFGDPGIINR